MTREEFARFLEKLRKADENGEDTDAIVKKYVLLGEHDVLACYLNSSCITCKQVDIQIAVLDSIHITWERRNKATEIRWAAGTTEPRLTLDSTISIEPVFSVRRQRIRIEETSSVDTHSTDDTIIQCALHAVNILGVAM